MLKMAQVWYTFARKLGADLELPRLPLFTRAANGHGTFGNSEPLQGEVESALREWQAAQVHFDSVSGVTEPDLVDHAIYHLEAAQRKYMYLLRRVQQGWNKTSPAGKGE